MHRLPPPTRPARRAQARQAIVRPSARPPRPRLPRHDNGRFDARSALDPRPRRAPPCPGFRQRDRRIEYGHGGGRDRARDRSGRSHPPAPGEPVAPEPRQTRCANNVIDLAERHLDRCPDESQPFIAECESLFNVVNEQLAQQAPTPMPLKPPFIAPSPESNVASKDAADRRRSERTGPSPRPACVQLPHKRMSVRALSATPLRNVDRGSRPHRR